MVYSIHHDYRFSIDDCRLAAKPTQRLFVLLSRTQTQVVLNFLRGLRVWFCREQLDREFSAGLAFHREKQVEQKMMPGTNAKEARGVGQLWRH
jgi:hypothetical protein